MHIWVLSLVLGFLKLFVVCSSACGWILQGIPAAPLWDSASQQFVGMLTASDFITILQQVCVSDIITNLHLESMLILKILPQSANSCHVSSLPFNSHLYIGLYSSAYPYMTWVECLVKEKCGWWGGETVREQWCSVS
jgi:hypothetical protein